MKEKLANVSLSKCFYANIYVGNMDEFKESGSDGSLENTGVCRLYQEGVKMLVLYHWDCGNEVLQNNLLISEFPILEIIPGNFMNDL